MKSPATRLTDSANELTAGLPEVVLRPYRPVPAGKTQRLAERVLGIVEEDGHFARGLVGHDDVRQPVAVHVGHRDVRRRDAGGHRDRSRETPRRGLQGDGDAVVQCVGGDQVVEPVSGQVGGGEARGQGRRREGGAAGDRAVRR